VSKGQVKLDSTFSTRRDLTVCTTSVIGLHPLLILQDHSCIANIWLYDYEWPYGLRTEEHLDF